MIVARSPLRISLGGGGTDLPAYSEAYGGFLLAGAIQLQVTVHVEEAASPIQTDHPIIREALQYLGLQAAKLKITSTADVAAGTGLGSSGSFTTALLQALHQLKGTVLTPRALAEEAYYIERIRLQQPIGKQDPYIAAFGGLHCFTFQRNGEVEVTPLKVSPKTRQQLEQNLVLFFTGFTRQAASILKDQADMIEQLHFIKALGLQSKMTLEQGKLNDFAALMHVHWQHKKQCSPKMTNPQMNAWYELARANGAIGGKVIGAGGGGFLLFYTETPQHLSTVLTAAGLSRTAFCFSDTGTQIEVHT